MLFRKRRHSHRSMIPILALLPVLGLLAVANPVTAHENQQSLSNALQELQQNLQRSRQRLNEATRSLENQQAQAGEHQATVQDLEAHRADLEQQVVDLDASISRTRTRVAELAGRYAEREEIFRLRIRTQYEKGPVSYLKVLLGAGSWSDFWFRLDAVQRILAADRQLMDEMTELGERLVAQEESLDLQRAELVARRVELAELEEQHKVAVAAARRTAQATKSQIEEIRREVEAEEAASQRMQEQLAALARRPSNLNPASLYFIRPFPEAPITSPFGPRLHPILKVWKTHTGVDYGLPYGAPVYASERGRVITARYVSGYGNTVIIDHGKGYTTLYAHMSAILVKEGQNVTQGQQIGKVGSTGYSTGPHAHFEVRINGEPRDPLQYIGREIKP